MGTKKLLVGIGAAVLASASTASAGFIVTGVKTERADNNDVWILRAQNDGAGTGTKLLAVSVTVGSVEQNLKIAITDADFDGVDDADVNLRSVGAPAPGAAAITGSYVRFGSPASFLIGGNVPEGYSDANGDGTTDPGGATRKDFFLATKSFRVDGFNGSGGILATAAPGIQFAAVVVPRGTNILVTGQLAGDQGNAQTFEFTSIPEPTALGFIGLAGAALVSRRRRKA
jgi:hypothetical protein